MIVKLDKRTVEVVGKWTCLLMLICLPIRIGVYLYENSELGMIKKARSLYEKPNLRNLDGYIEYYNNFPTGKYAEETEKIFINNFSSIEHFYDTNNRTYSWYKIDKELQPKIAQLILQKHNTEENKEDFQIYYIDHNDKIFLEDRLDFKNLGKRRKFTIKENNEDNI